MATNYGARATLRFNGDNLDPDEISQALEVSASRAFRKGDDHFSQNGKYIRKRPTGAWHLSAPKSDDAELEDQILWLLRQCSDDFVIWASFQSRFEINVFAGIFLQEANEGLSLRPSTLEQLGSRGIELQLDIYGPDE